MGLAGVGFAARRGELARHRGAAHSRPVLVGKEHAGWESEHYVPSDIRVGLGMVGEIRTGRVGGLCVNRSMRLVISMNPALV